MVSLLGGNKDVVDVIIHTAPRLQAEILMLQKPHQLKPTLEKKCQTSSQIKLTTS